MELPLWHVSDCKQCLVIRFLTAKNTSTAEIHQQLSSVYGEETMSIQHVRKWVRDFSNGCEEVHDLARIWKLDPEFYTHGISKLVSRYDKCLHINGNYVEISFSQFFSLFSQFLLVFQNFFSFFNSKITYLGGFWSRELE